VTSNGFLAPYPEILGGTPFTCPDNTFKWSTSASSCVICPAGSDCSVSSEGSCSSGNTQGGLGDPACQGVANDFPGYKTGSGVNAITIEACAYGEYKDSSSNGNSCTSCAANSECDFTQVLSTCGSEYYSVDGKTYCQHLPLNT
jgi:hypothetical protein